MARQTVISRHLNIIQTGAWLLLACMIPCLVSEAASGRGPGQWGFEVGNGRKDIRTLPGRAPVRNPNPMGAGYVDEFTEVVTSLGVETPRVRTRNGVSKKSGQFH